MQYFILFLEGVITFISPCMLPMLPIYVLYFAGTNEEGKGLKAFINSLGFVLGFTAVFVLLGAFAGAVGGFLKEYNTLLNIISGLIVILLGLGFLNLIKLPFIGQMGKLTAKVEGLRFMSAILFGMIFSISWTPCVGAFLGSALMQAGQQGEMVKGIIMLLFYSLGLGLPFMVCAVLIDRLKSAFDAVKRHYKVINIISGVFLILVGILMMTGRLGYLLLLLS